MDALRQPSPSSPRIVCPQTYVSRVCLIRDETRDWSKVLADSLRDDPAFQVMNVTPNATRLAVSLCSTALVVAGTLRRSQSLSNSCPKWGMVS